MGDTEPTTKRRRIRRRKKSKNVSSFLDSSSDEEKVKAAAKKHAKSSSPSSSSSDPDSDSLNKTRPTVAKKESKEPKRKPIQPTESSSSDDASSDEPDVEEDVAPAESRQPLTYTRDSPPPLVDYKDPTIQQRFRTWYLTQITSEFGDELDTIRKTETVSGGTMSSKKNAGPTRSKGAIEESRLEVLIDALASGVDVFNENEMEMILGKVQASGQDTEMKET